MIIIARSETVINALVTVFVQISKHSSKLGQLEAELVSLNDVQVAFGAEKSC